MIDVEEIEERILHALSIPYKTGSISKDLQKRIGIIENSGDEKRFHKAKKSLIKDSILVFEKLGTKKIYYLPQYSEEVFKHWNISCEIDLSLRIDHAKKIQELVINPLIEKYKDAELGFEYNIDKKYVKEVNEWGIFYEKITSINLNKNYKNIMMGIPGPNILNVRNKFLLNDYLENHAPALLNLIDEFNELYNNLWMFYYDINEEVRNIIYKRTNLPIITWDSVKFDNFPKTKNHITTNLQFELIHKLGLFDYPFFNNQSEFSYSIRLNKCMYECFSEKYNPYKIYLRVNKKDISKEDFSVWIDTLISLIISDVKKSNKIRNLSKKYSIIMDKYRYKRIELLDFLENDLIKEVFDGVCNYCV